MEAWQSVANKIHVVEPPSKKRKTAEPAADQAPNGDADDDLVDEEEKDEAADEEGAVKTLDTKGEAEVKQTADVPAPAKESVELKDAPVAVEALANKEETANGNDE